MKNFIFKSTDADFKKMFQLIETIQKNVLYLTYNLDRVNKEIHKLVTDKDLQKQVDDYFEKDPFGSSFRTANKIADEEE